LHEDSGNDLAGFGRFPLVAADARPAEIDPDGDNEIGTPERKVVTVAVTRAIDALQRSSYNPMNAARSKRSILEDSFTPYQRVARFSLV
jgi:hypothetical protein